jgi:hypothetical protein
VGTILDYCPRFKMGSPDAYTLPGRFPQRRAAGRGEARWIDRFAQMGENLPDRFRVEVDIAVLPFLIRA